jgi:hypothetical protein
MLIRIINVSHRKARQKRLTLLSNELCGAKLTEIGKDVEE